MQDRSITEEKTPAAEPSTIRFLLIDYDGCALVSYRDSGKPDFQPFASYSGLLRGNTAKPTPPAFNPHLLSPGLIAFSQTMSFAGFYGCTHRCLLTDYDNSAAKDHIEFAKLLGAKDKNFDAEDYFTTNITRNLIAATGLECIAVSTPDDSSKTALKECAQTRCGYGYRQLIIPYEALLKSSSKAKETDPLENLLYDSDAYVKCFGPCLPAYAYDCTTKQPQLRQIAEHAGATHPEKHIELHYLDDTKVLCDDAATLSPECLPENVTLHIYHHTHGSEIREKMATVQGTNKMINSVNRAVYQDCPENFITDLQQATTAEGRKQAFETAIKKRYWYAFEALLNTSDVDQALKFQLIFSAMQQVIKENHDYWSLSILIMQLTRMNLLTAFITHEKQGYQLVRQAYENKADIMLEKLAKAGFAAEAMPYLETCFLAAVSANQSRQIRCLLALRKDCAWNINARDAQGQTALSIANAAGHYSLCSQFVAAGADPFMNTLPTLTQNDIRTVTLRFDVTCSMRFFNQASRTSRQTLTRLLEEKSDTERYQLAQEFVELHPGKDLANHLRKFL